VTPVHKAPPVRRALKVCKAFQERKDKPAPRGRKDRRVPRARRATKGKKAKRELLVLLALEVLQAPLVLQGRPVPPVRKASLQSAALVLCRRTDR
jgi:hypothetical protein